MDHRVRGRFTEYKVRWKGFGPKDDSWVPEAELNCDTLLNKYFKTAGAKQEEVYEVGMKCCSHLSVCFIVLITWVIILVTLTNGVLVSVLLLLYFLNLFILDHYLVMPLFFLLKLAVLSVLNSIIYFFF